MAVGTIRARSDATFDAPRGPCCGAAGIDLLWHSGQPCQPPKLTGETATGVSRSAISGSPEEFFGHDKARQSTTKHSNSHFGFWNSVIHALKPRCRINAAFL